MLMRFKVGNFLSFNDVQEFSMLAGKVRSKLERVSIDDSVKLLKFAAIFGANASGKSNMVAAMRFACESIVLRFPKNSMRQYCKIDSGNKEKPSYFEFEIAHEGRYYSYGFEIILSRESIVSEWLSEISPAHQDRELFSRDVVKGDYSVSKYFEDKGLSAKLDGYADDIKSDGSILLLRVLNQNKDTLYAEKPEAHIFRSIFQFFLMKFDINFPDKPISNYSYFITNQNFDQICTTLNAFGTGITKYSLVEIGLEKIDDELKQKFINEIMPKLMLQRAQTKSNDHLKAIFRDNSKNFYLFEINDEETLTCKTIQFNHGNEDIFFSLSEESDGTIRLLDLITVLFETEQNSVFVIDEIDRCLHPQLTYKFISEYLKIAAERKIQLIVTTHESRLLDFDLLRKDEIWFVNKSTEGASSIYSLDEYNERFDKKIDKAYLEGRYGGVPIFSTVFPLGGA